MVGAPNVQSVSDSTITASAGPSSNSHIAAMAGPASAHAASSSGRRRRSDAPPRRHREIGRRGQDTSHGPPRRAALVARHVARAAGPPHRTRKRRQRRPSAKRFAAATAPPPLAGSMRAISGVASWSTATWISVSEPSRSMLQIEPASGGVRPRCSPLSSASASGRIATDTGAPAAASTSIGQARPKISTAPSLRTWPGSTLISGVPTKRATSSVAG